MDWTFRFRVQKANFAFLFSGGLKKKSNPLVNFPLLTKSVTWGTVCLGRSLCKQAISVLALVCSVTKTHTTAISSLASARKIFTRPPIATNRAVAAYKDKSLSEIVIAS